MRKHLPNLLTRVTTALALAAGLFALGGCGGKEDLPEPIPAAGPIPLNSFVRTWAQDLDLRGNDRVKAVHLRDETVYAYTRAGRVIVMARDSGRPRWSTRIRASDREGMRPPVELQERVVVPTSSTLEVFEPTEGTLTKSVPLELAARSDAVGAGNLVFLGGDFANAGRVVALDITQEYVHNVWSLMIPKGGLAATPALFEEVLFIGGGDGMVYAVAAENREPLWPLKGGGFATDGPIEAAVKADDTGVYAASTDGNLYALNRGTGRLKWQYYGTRALTEDPVVTADMVYLPIPDAGIAAIRKGEVETGNPQLEANRQPVWLAAGMSQFLSEDEQFAYLRRARDNAIVAVDRATGEQMFENHRRDLTHFASNTKGDGIIYAASETNRVLAIKPVLRPGVVGELVWNEYDAGEGIALAR